MRNLIKVIVLTLVMTPLFASCTTSTEDDALYQQSLTEGNDGSVEEKPGN
ncbi:hypothetical protein [Spongiimicrobium salis]